MVFFTLLSYFSILLGLCPYLFTFMTLLALLSYLDHLFFPPGFATLMIIAGPARLHLSKPIPGFLLSPLAYVLRPGLVFFFIPILMYLIRLFCRTLQLHGSKISFRLVPIQPSN